MKRFLPLFLGIILTLTACDKDDCNPSQNTGSFEVNKAIVVDYKEDAHQNYHQVVAGENLVFRYSHTAAQCDDVMDDEWGYTLTFEVDKDATQFRFEGTELAATNAFYREFGAWVGTGTYALENGVIEGSRISDSKWRVKVNVIAPPLSQSSHLKQIAFEEVFVK